MNTSAFTFAAQPDAVAAADTLTVFAGFRLIASGPRDDVMALLRRRDEDDTPPLVFDDRTGERLDLDLRPDAPSAAAPAPPRASGHSGATDSTDSSGLANAVPARKVGRPRLGVVAREVTLLPRHWDWLNRQPGGASVALRRLVDEARRVHADRDAVRAAREATYRFMTAIAGDLPGFEEATRALFASQQARFDALLALWPVDLAAHARKLAAAGWTA